MEAALVRYGGSWSSARFGIFIAVAIGLAGCTATNISVISEKAPTKDYQFVVVPESTGDQISGQELSMFRQSLIQGLREARAFKDVFDSTSGREPASMLVVKTQLRRVKLGGCVWYYCARRANQVGANVELFDQDKIVSFQVWQENSGHDPSPVPPELGREAAAAVVRWVRGAGIGN